MLHYAQHDRLGMANLTLLSLSFKKERDVSASPKQGEVNPARECFTALTLAFSITGDVIPSVARNPVWMLHCAQHDRLGMANLTLLFPKGEGRFGIAETG